MMRRLSQRAGASSSPLSQGAALRKLQETLITLRTLPPSTERTALVVAANVLCAELMGDEQPPLARLSGDDAVRHLRLRGPVHSLGLDGSEVIVVDLSADVAAPVTIVRTPADPVEFLCAAVTAGVLEEVGGAGGERAAASDRSLAVTAGGGAVAASPTLRLLR